MGACSLLLKLAGCWGTMQIYTFSIHLLEGTGLGVHWLPIFCQSTCLPGHGPTSMLELDPLKLSLPPLMSVIYSASRITGERYLEQLAPSQDFLPAWPETHFRAQGTLLRHPHW